MLLVSYEGVLSDGLRGRYKTAYKVYQRAVTTVAETRKTKPFQLDKASIEAMDPIVRELDVFSEGQFDELSEEVKA